MTSKPKTATNDAGQTVELGKPHEPNPSDRKPEERAEKIDMNPGEPARPFVGGDEEPKESKKAGRR